MKLLSLLCLLFAHLHLKAQPPAIQVEVAGSGRPTLFLPGFATPGRVFAQAAHGLGVGRNYHFVSYAGLAGAPPIDTPFYASVREALVDYVLAEDLRQVDLIGHSMGGNLATELAAALPDRVARVVIVDALPCMREVMMPGVPAEYIRYDSPQVVSSLALGPDSVRTVNRVMASGMATRAADVCSLQAWMNASDRETFVYGYTDLLRLDLRPLLPRIEAPTTILASPQYGEDIARGNYEAQYAGLKNHTLHFAPGGKHFVVLDEPTWFVTQLRAALPLQDGASEE